MTRDEVFAKLKVKIVEGLGVEEEKVQMYYVSGEAHWMYYARGTVEEEIVLSMLHSLPSDVKTPSYHFGTTTTISILNILYPVLMIGITIMFFINITNRCITI